jgi:hypothetical protein
MKMQLLGLAVLMLAAAFSLSGCSKVADLSVTRGLADQFMLKLSRADFKGAYEMCDPHAVSEDNLRAIRNNPEIDDLWEHYTSLVHGDGGMLSQEGAFRQLRLAPATVRDKPGYTVHITFREYDEGWLVMALMIDTE